MDSTTTDELEDQYRADLDGCGCLLALAALLALGVMVWRLVAR